MRYYKIIFQTYNLKIFADNGRIARNNLDIFPPLFLPVFFSFSIKIYAPQNSLLVQLLQACRILVVKKLFCLKRDKKKIAKKTMNFDKNEFQYKQCGNKKL